LKRLAVGLIILALVVAAAITALPFLVSSEGVRAQIIAKVAAVTGRQMSFRDAPKVFFNPYLGIEVGGVVFEGSREFPDDPPLVQMEKLRGRIAFLPALFGRIEIGQYEFIRPRFNLKVFQDGRSSWQFPEGKVWDVLAQARAQRESAVGGAKPDISGIAPVRLGDFQIVDGIIDYESAPADTREIITNVNVSIRWPDTASAWAVRGSSIWRDEAIEMSIRSTQPLLLLAGGTSAATGEIKSGALRFSFEGDVNLLAGLHLVGKASISAPSLPRVVNFFGGRMEVGATPASLEANGKINATPKQVQLSEATIALDGNPARGVLQMTIAEGGRPQLNGSLAFQSLELTPYLASLRQEAETGRTGSPGLQLLDRFDCDLRISAAKAMLGTIAVADFGAALTVRNSELLFDLGSASLFGGNAIGKLQLKRKEGLPHLIAEGKLTRIELGQLVAGLPRGAFSLSGPADISLDARSTGATLRDLLAGMRGWASLKGGPGSFGGASFARIMTSMAAKPDASNAIRLQGETPFAEIAGDVLFDQGTIWVRGFEIGNPDLRSHFFGRADMSSGGLAMRARLAPSAADAKVTLLVIGGSLSAPLVSRDVEAIADPFGPGQ